MLLFHVIRIPLLFVHLGNEAGPCNDAGEPGRTWATQADDECSCMGMASAWGWRVFVHGDGECMGMASVRAWGWRVFARAWGWRVHGDDECFLFWDRQVDSIERDLAHSNFVGLNGHERAR